jgi:hypothetical protein
MKSMEQAIGRKKPSESGITLEGTLRAVFSSCTSGAEANVTDNKDEDDVIVEQEKPPQQSRSQSASSKREQQKEIGEHIYAQLFYDDQVRASKAVSTLREIQTTTRTRAPPPSALPKQFPASSPPRPTQHSDLDILQTQTFDDSISAISAHTLEAMARASPTMGHNPLFPREVPVSKYHHVDPSPIFFPKEHEAIAFSPEAFTPESRVRSSGDYSTPSKNSHSTRTTESSSFDNWQREDKKYWVDQAKHEQFHKHQRRPSHGNGVSLESVGVYYTVYMYVIVSHSLFLCFGLQSRRTATTSSKSSFRHPHDTVSHDAFFDKEPVAKVEMGHRSSRKGARSFFRITNNNDGEI